MHNECVVVGFMIDGRDSSVQWRVTEECRDGALRCVVRRLCAVYGLNGSYHSFCAEPCGEKSASHERLRQIEGRLAIHTVRSRESHVSCIGMGVESASMMDMDGSLVMARQIRI